MYRPPIQSTPSTAAFSLMETVLALGVVSFCILALMGLLMPALQSLRTSEDDSKMPSLLQNVFRQVRTEIATGKDFEEPPAPWVDDKREYLYTIDLVPLEAPEVQGAYYQVQVELRDPAPSLANVSKETLKTLLIRVQWPYSPNGGTPANSSGSSLLIRNPAYIPPSLQP